MSGKLSSNAQVRYNALAGFSDRVQRVYGLVELYATARTRPDQYIQPIGRAFTQLKLQLMGAGMDGLSQLCGAMEMAAKRGLSQTAKARILREGVGSLKFQLELEMRTIVSEDQAAQRREQREEGAET